jgi:hypothetical protein
VKALEDVEAALQALYAAAVGGELNEAIENVMKSRMVSAFASKRIEHSPVARS